jgi:hypothetical protein
VLRAAGDDPVRERRQAGLASNNLEASLQRAMHEPRRGQRDILRDALVADAILRRIAGRLAALSLDSAALAKATQSPTSPWVPEALEALAAGRAAPPRPQTEQHVEALERLARQVELLGFTLAKGRMGEGREAVLF